MARSDSYDAIVNRWMFENGCPPVEQEPRSVRCQKRFNEIWDETPHRSRSYTEIAERVKFEELKARVLEWVRDDDEEFVKMAFKEYENLFEGQLPDEEDD